MLVPGMKLRVQGLDPDTQITLEELLGGGAFGDVFKARGDSSGTLFAVKFPKPTFNDDSEMVAFQNEAMAAQEIRHPNVVNVLYVEAAPTQTPPYLVMEYLQDGTLKTQLDRFRNSETPLPLELLQTWTNDLIEGISAINSKMLHRDLKPDNILLDKNVLKIGDFGLSKVVGVATRTNTFKGGQHVLYMAPEGWKQENNDIQIDMYAIGIILFELASLDYPYEVPPFTSGTEPFREMHLFQQPKSLRQLRPDLPIGFCHLVARLMEKRPHDRFSDWNEVKAAFERVWETAKLEQLQGGANKITALLEQTERIHQSVTSKRLEQEKLAALRRERRQLDAYQEKKLIANLQELVRDFNERSSLGQILEHPGYIFVLPFGDKPKSIHFDFFVVDPPLNLKRGQVRFAATLNDSGYPRLNYLLCRRDESDLYGEWIACEARNSALVRPDKRHNSPIEPFGFREHEIHQIEISEQAMHVFNVVFSEDVDRVFLDAISESMDRA